MFGVNQEDEFIFSEENTSLRRKYEQLYKRIQHHDITTPLKLTPKKRVNILKREEIEIAG